MTRRSLEGAELGVVDLEPTIFGVEPHLAVLHQVITAQLAAKRAGTQSTKTRKEVRGGGRKPFRQKGTGGARQGTIRAPHYPGGGIALGPKPRNYEQRTPKKMIRIALYSALSDRAARTASRWWTPSPRGPSPRRGRADRARRAGPRGQGPRRAGREDVVAYRSFKNLVGVTTIDAGELNAYDVLDADWVLFTDATLPSAKEHD